MKPLKLFVSMPMNGKSAHEIAEQMRQAHEEAERVAHMPLTLIDTVFDLPEDASPLHYIGESIKKLAEADVAYFCDGWEKARGCRIEWMCARDYGVDRIESLESMTRLVHCPTCGNLLHKSQWISVKERLPEGKVLAANFTPETYGYGEIIIGYVEAVKALSVDWEPDLYVAENDCEILRHVTHWMPLPEPPKEDA